jgi:Na+:H+ antiporter, NhaA family
MDKFKKTFQFLSELAAFLLLGTGMALIWANVDAEGYHHFVHDAWFHSAALVHTGDHGVSFHFLVNDLFMVFFFGIAMKEVSESFLPGGALSSPQKAAMPVIATAGGVLGPIAAFFALNAIMSPSVDISNGWAIPAATDIAYCWLFARLIFGNGHPAVTFLLVLAVLDDLIGMMIIAFFYTPEGGVHVESMVWVVGAMVICEVFRRVGVKSYLPYVAIGGPLAWYGLHHTGVHPALALVPIIPFMPHAERDSGLFEDAENHHDTMNSFEHATKPFVDIGLFGFGLANAGVVLSGEALVAAPTMIIFLSLLIGKTLGVWGFSFAGIKMGFKLPEPMTLNQTIVLGCTAGIGFTVALFVTTVAIDIEAVPGIVELSGGGTTDIGGMLKLGALLSFAAGPIAYAISRMLKVEKIHATSTDDGHH